MKPFPHDLNLGYGLCKCKYCKKAKAKRVNHNTAMRMKAKMEAAKEAEETTEQGVD
jgi:hypothetical protein